MVEKIYVKIRNYIKSCEVTEDISVGYNNDGLIDELLTENTLQAKEINRLSRIVREYERLSKEDIKNGNKN